jgi:putative tricarboxylic transport membrane protein
MSEILQNLSYGFGVALQPTNLLMAFVGAFVGTVIGVLPGIGPVSGIALLIPLIIGLHPASAMIMLTAVYYGTMYGGSTTSILVNVPGEASSVATTFDGYQMSLQGRAGPALAIAAIVIHRRHDQRGGADVRALAGALGSDLWSGGNFALMVPGPPASRPAGENLVKALLSTVSA